MGRDSLAVIYVHILPAILAFVTKVALPTGTIARTRLFVPAVTISMGLNVMSQDFKDCLAARPSKRARTCTTRA